jgi:hypothetical protein
MLVYQIIRNLEEMFLNKEKALPFYQMQKIKAQLELISNIRNLQSQRERFINFCEEFHAVLKFLTSLDPKPNNAVKKAMTTLNSGKLVTYSHGERKIPVEMYIHLNKIKKDFAQNYSLEFDTTSQYAFPKSLLKTILFQMEIMMDFLKEFPAEEDFNKYKEFMNNRSGNPEYIKLLNQDKTELLKTISAMGSLIYDFEHKINNLYEQNNESIIERDLIAVFQCQGSTVNYTELATDLLKASFRKLTVFIIGMTQGDSLLQNQLIMDSLTQLYLIRHFELPPLSENLPPEIFNQKEIIRDNFNEKLKQILGLFKKLSYEESLKLKYTPSAHYELITLFANGLVGKDLEKPGKKLTKKIQSDIDVLVIGRRTQYADLPPPTLTNQIRYEVLNDNELFLLYAEILYLTFWLSSCLKNVAKIFSVTPEHLYRVKQDNPEISLKDQFDSSISMFGTLITICEKELQRYKPELSEKDEKSEAQSETMNFYADAANKTEITKIHTALTTIIKPRIEVLMQSPSSSTENDEKQTNEALQILQEIQNARRLVDKYASGKIVPLKSLGKAISEGCELRIRLQNIRKQYEIVAADYATLAQDPRWIDRSKTQLEDLSVSMQAANKNISECEEKIEKELDKLDYTNLAKVDDIFNTIKRNMNRVDSLITINREALTVLQTLLQNAEIAKRKSLLGSSGTLFGTTKPIPQEGKSADKHLRME